jgi:hypothetical protein
MSKVLTQAQIYAPNIEPIETIKLLAKSHALYEMARIMQVSPSTMRCFLEKHRIVPVDHNPQLTAEKISKSRQTKLAAEREAVSYFTCDKINYGCGKDKPIMLRDVHNPKICSLCAKNRRRSLS